MSADLQFLLNSAVDSADLPYVVAAVGDRSRTLWEGSAGSIRPGVRAAPDTVFRIASMSKAVAATAALILADRGLLDWEMPVAALLPAFDELPLLEADGHHVRLGRPNVKATLRQLATHSSGLTYEFYDAATAQHIERENIPSLVSGKRASLGYPLRFEPGSGWAYGGGIDWLGCAVEVIAGEPIVEFCRAEIFGPLQMIDTHFELPPAKAGRLGDVAARTTDGHIIPSPIDLSPPSRPEFYAMGNALYSTAHDYLRFLRMWLGGGELDGTRLFSQASAKHALANQLGALHVVPLATTFPLASNDLDPLPGHRLTHSLGFARLEEPVAGGRRAGSQFWGGVMNTHFWFDPASDIAAVFMTQMIPFLDPLVMAAYGQFERCVYACFDRGPR